MSEDDEQDTEVPTVGWDAIDGALCQVYGDQEPLHFGTLIKFAVGGADPIDGISVYVADAPSPHWHYVTYGFSELYEKESPNPEVNGFGFELTFRLSHDPADEEPPRWPVGLLQNLARYVFESGNAFGAGHHMNCNGPIALEAETELTAIAFGEDPDLPPIETPHGQLEFLQVVGLTADELELVQTWNTKAFLREVLDPVTPRWVTDLGRRSLLEDPALRAALTARAEAEGSSQSAAFLASLGWEEAEEEVVLRVGALAVANVTRLLRGRTAREEPFVLYGGEREEPVRVVPGETATWSSDSEEELRVDLTQGLAAAVASELKPQVGTYRWEELPGFSIEVVLSEITDQAGDVIEEVG